MKVQNQPSLKYAWFVWAVAVSFVLFQVVLQTSVSVMLKPLQADLHISLTEFGLLAASFFYPYIFMQIPSGMLVDSFGIRKVLVGALLLISIGCITYAMSHSLGQAITGRILIGIGAAPAIALAMNIGSNWFPLSMFALLAALTESLAMLGGLLGEHGISALLHYGFDWRRCIGMCISVGIFLLLIAFFFIFDKTSTVEMKTDEKLLQPNKAQPKLSQRIWLVIKDSQNLLNGLYVSFSFAPVLVFASLWGIPFFRHALNTSLLHAAEINSVIFIGLAFGMPILGKLEQRMKINQLMIICSLFGCLLMGTLLMANHLSEGMIKLLLFLLGMMTCSYVLPFVLVKKNVEKSSQGMAMGYVNMMCFVVGSLFLQPLTGWLLHQLDSQQFASYQLALISMPLCFAISGLLAFFIIVPTNK